MKAKLLNIYLYLRQDEIRSEIRQHVISLLSPDLASHMEKGWESRSYTRELQKLKKTFRYRNALNKAQEENELLHAFVSMRKELLELAGAELTGEDDLLVDEKLAQIPEEQLNELLAENDTIRLEFEKELPLLQNADRNAASRSDLVRRYRKSLQSREKKTKQEKRVIFRDRAKEYDLSAFFEMHLEEIMTKAGKKLTDYLSSALLHRLKYTELEDRTAVDKIPLTEKTLTPFLEWAIDDDGTLSEGLILMAFAPRKALVGSLSHFLFVYLTENDPVFREAPTQTPKSLLYAIDENPYPLQLLKNLKGSFTEVKLGECLSSNPYYERFNRNFVQAARRVAREKKQRLSLQRHMLSAIPENYIDFYPEARGMQRHFILHVGPTNSGKTYDAIKALSEAYYGIYLAPLRLLAYEQFENLNAKGVPCSLVTGEERILVEGAEHQSSTIELANFRRFYDVAVIDEAQMITDEERGGHWTAAILGLQAYEIHVCMAPHAEEIVTKLIEDCGDTYEVIHHQRQTPLLMEKEPFIFPDSVREGDALIVFSKRNVHAVASELNERGLKCSIIYGALPYDVRHREAERFSENETQVVVATDAIGMGLNLPVKRIVFLETEKFNGHTIRHLETSEIQQIAGRAGRFGMFDEGLVTTMEEDQDFIEYGLSAPIEPIGDAMLAFPESLLSIDARVSKILTEWNDMAAAAGFLKATVKTQISLAQHLESYTSDKELIYSLITIPFDERDNELFDLWSELSQSLIRRRDLHMEKRLQETLNGLEHMSVTELEHAYSITDLLFGFATRADLNMDETFISSKRMISEAIMKLLSQQKLQQKTCPSCGRALSWNYPYKICSRCFRNRRDGYSRIR